MKEHIENLQKSFELSSQQIDDVVNPLEIAALLEIKPVDNADLMSLIRITSRLDEKALLALGELIYLGGGSELVSIVSDVKQGKAISL